MDDWTEFCVPFENLRSTGGPVSPRDCLLSVEPAPLTRSAAAVTLKWLAVIVRGLVCASAFTFVQCCELKLCVSELIRRTHMCSGLDSHIVAVHSGVSPFDMFLSGILFGLLFWMGYVICCARSHRRISNANILIEVPPRMHLFVWSLGAIAASIIGLYDSVSLAILVISFSLLLALANKRRSLLSTSLLSLLVQFPLIIALVLNVWCGHEFICGMDRLGLDVIRSTQFDSDVYRDSAGHQYVSCGPRPCRCGLRPGSISFDLTEPAVHCQFRESVGVLAIYIMYSLIGSLLGVIWNERRRPVAQHVEER
ncbi:MAG: hypothetical protein K2W95_26195 [Candidatus Obscuribacterales bacterium]|nr:hypothetical protein [Candidatus Obscuribacterales bacterium]